MDWECYGRNYNTAYCSKKCHLRPACDRYYGKSQSMKSVAEILDDITEKESEEYEQKIKERVMKEKELNAI